MAQRGTQKGFNIQYAILGIGSGLSQEITRFYMSTVNEHVRRVTATSSFLFFSFLFFSFLFFSFLFFSFLFFSFLFFSFLFFSFLFFSMPFTCTSGYRTPRGTDFTLYATYTSSLLHCGYTVPVGLDDTLFHPTCSYHAIAATHTVPARTSAGPSTCKIAIAYSHVLEDTRCYGIKAAPV